MRIRTLKPEFWMHEGLAACSEFTRLLAIALLNWADDEGYFYANPILIRGQVFPFLDDSTTIPRSLQDLSSVGWIRLGKDKDGRQIGQILNFAKHQRVDKPKPSNIKGLCEFQDESKTIPRIIQDASKEEGKGMERNGRERITPIPPSGKEREDRNSPTSPEAIRIAQLYRRRETTRWSPKEVKAFKAIGHIDQNDLDAVCRYTESEMAKGENGRHRRDLLTFLNNFPGEVDRARANPPKQQAAPRQIQFID